MRGPGTDSGVVAQFELDNFKAAIALHLAYYNFVKTHGSLRCTPAMEAGIEKSAWTVSDLVNAA
jgi:hypothetical protein